MRVSVAPRRAISKLAVITTPPTHLETCATRTALWVTLLATLALSLLCVLHERTFFWHGDYALFFSPYFEEIVRAWRGGEWPILTRDSWGAGNMAGEYQLGTFSVFHNLALVLIWLFPLSLPGKAAAFSTLHLALLAAGTVLLARRRGLSAPLAVAVALTVAFNGWLITWGASQWVASLMGFTWVPWAWWAFLCAQQAARPRVRWLLAAPFVYLTISSGNPFAPLILAIVSLWLALRTLAGTRRLADVAPLVAGWAFGLALSAPAWLLLIDFHHNSVRGQWGWVPQWEWLVPWRAWPALWLPSLMTPWRDFAFQLSPHFGIELAGGLIPASALVAALVKRRREFARRFAWELLLLAVAMLLASLPLFGAFRWSYRFLPLVHLVLALLGAEALALLGTVPVAHWALLCTGVATLLGATLLGNASLPLTLWEWAILLAWRATGCRLATARWQPWTPAAATGALLLAVYWCLSTTQWASLMPLRENLLRPEPLDPRRLYLGIYSQQDLDRGMVSPPAWGAALRPGNTALYADLHFVNGYSSFSALGIPEMFEQFGSTSRSMSEALLSADSLPILDLIGVDGLVFGSDYWDLTRRLGPEWVPVFSSSEAKVFHREPARASAVKALSAYDPEPALVLAQPQVHLARESRQRVSVEIDPAPPGEPADAAADIGVVTARREGPSVIAFMRPYFPGYRATFNGRSIPVENYVGVIPAVRLPAGAHGALELTYSPDSLRAGVCAAIAASAAWLALFWRLVITSARCAGR